MIHLAIILIVLVLASCETARNMQLENEPKPEPGVIRYKDRFYVPLNERNDLERRATNGDKNAAKQLANYWQLYRNDGVKGERWLRMAEEPQRKIRRTISKHVKGAVYFKDNFTHTKGQMHNWAWSYNGVGEVINADHSNNAFDQSWNYDGIKSRKDAQFLGQYP